MEIKEFKRFDIIKFNTGYLRLNLKAIISFKDKI